MSINITVGFFDFLWNYDFGIKRNNITVPDKYFNSLPGVLQRSLIVEIKGGKENETTKT
jgi:hypothetical protein